MIPIEDKKRVDWNAIRAEYIGGGISQRKLAKKYGLSEAALMQKANREGWRKDRDEAISESIARSQQKTADAIADNAIIAAEIKRRLLMRLKRTEEKFPYDATEVRVTESKKTVVYKLRDLTAAYRDLTEDITTAGNGTNELLQSLIDLERGRHD